MNRIFSKPAGAISKIIFNFGSYNFLTYLECVRSYTWSKGPSDPDLSSVRLLTKDLHNSFNSETFFSLFGIGPKSFACIEQSKHGTNHGKFKSIIDIQWPLTLRLSVPNQKENPLPFSLSTNAQIIRAGSNSKITKYSLSDVISCAAQIQTILKVR